MNIFHGLTQRSMLNAQLQSSTITTLAQQIVSIQPMNLPSGLIFYQDFTYKFKPYYSSLDQLQKILLEA